MCGEVFMRKDAKNHQCMYMMKKYLDTRKKDLKVMQSHGKINQSKHKNLENEQKELIEE